MKIAILGGAPSSRMLAPFNDPTWEIWACSPSNYSLPRVDAWFELHLLDRKIAHPMNAPYIHTLAEHPRVYVAHPDDRFPNAIKFPVAPLLEKYGVRYEEGGPRYDYFFSSSVAYMLAFAIEHRPEKIGIWGVDMAAHEEWAFQRPACQYFIQKAIEAGIRIKIPNASDLKASLPLYGYKEHWPMWQKQKARVDELQERLTNAEKTIKEQETARLIFRGALEGMGYYDHTWIKPDLSMYDRCEMCGEPGDGATTAAGDYTSKEVIDAKDKNGPRTPRPKKPRRSATGAKPKRAGVQQRERSGGDDPGGFGC